MTQAQAAPRKDWLHKNHASLADAVQILPQLADPNSDAFKAVQAMIQQNPLLRNRADWPVVVAKMHLGQQAWNAITKPATAPVVKPAPRPSKPAPGALQHPQFVGTLWFQWLDKPTTGRVYDEENYQIGFLDIADTPCLETIAASREIGPQIHETRLGPKR